MKIIRVKYLDHYETFIREGKIEELGKSWIENLGWVVKEDDTYIFIARERWTEEESVHDRLAVIGILKSQITEMEVLKDDGG